MCQLDLSRVRRIHDPHDAFILVDYMDGVLQLDTLAAALTHESFEVDTKDREDHTFSGIMFDVACQSLPRGPLEYLEVQAVAVRGKLGPMT